MEMKSFMLLYKGPATPMEEMTPEQGRDVMAKWDEWIGRVGEALTDVGAPLANGEAVVDDGSSAAATDMVGYSIVRAEDVVAARTLLDGHPFLAEGSGKYRVEIHELLPLPA
jgi:YCII-related domain